MARLFRFTALSGLFVPVAGFLLVAALADSASAQSRSGSSSRASTTGSSRSGGTAASSPFGSRTLGGSTSPQGGGGNTGGGAAVESAQSGAGEISGNERFLRENRQGAFVGANTGEVGGVGNRQGSGGAAQRGGAGGLNNLFGPQGLFSQFGQGNNNFNRQNRGGQGRGQTPLRIPIRLGFEGRPVSAPQFTSKFENRLAKLPALNNLGKIEVAMEGRTAVLRGVVASEADRELAEGLARLEPEVGAVRNELVVAQDQPTAESLPPTSAVER